MLVSRAMGHLLDSFHFQANLSSEICYWNGLQNSDPDLALPRGVILPKKQECVQMPLPIPYHESALEKGASNVPGTTDHEDGVVVGSDVLFG